MQGRGVEQGIEKTFEWMEKAAEQGFADAQLGLATMYEYGRGVQADQTKSGEWMEKWMENMASQGRPETPEDFEAILRLGAMIEAATP